TNDATSPGGVTASTAVIVDPEYVALIVTVCAVCTVAASIRKLALRVPPATVTDAGTCATPASLLLSATIAPPAGAVAASGTAPSACCCPWIDCGLTTSAAPDGPGDGDGDGDGEGLGDGDGDGVGVGDGDVPPELEPPHCVRVSAAATMRTAIS